MTRPAFLEKINEKLAGAPDRALTVLLITIGILVIVVALRGKPYAKAFVATWLLAP
jgi:hypothetical protein